MFAERLPDRFFSIGMAEANAIGIAAGLARAGEIPFVNTFGVFATRRAFDQIAMQVAYPRTNVKIAGFMPGLTTPGGVTHQAIEDIALMRSLPNMTVVEPADAEQIRAAVAAAAAHDGPVYLRIKRGEVPVLDSGGAPPPFRLGEAQLLRPGQDGVIVGCGLMVTLALEAARVLAGRGLDVAVLNCHTIKPLDAALLTELASRTGCVLTAENHSVIGGLGSAVAEALMEAGVHCQFRRLGIRDTFAEGASPPYLFDKYGLSAAAIVTEFESLRAGAR